MNLDQGHNTVMPVRLESAALLSRVKHSTTEPLCSLGLVLPVLVNNIMISPFCKGFIFMKLHRWENKILETISNLQCKNSENTFHFEALII